MPWRPLKSTAFAICVYPFQATETDDLPLQVGDQVYVIEQGGSKGEWYRGYLVAFPSLLAGLTKQQGEPLDARVFSGIFPRNCVEIRELIGENGQERSDGQDESLSEDREQSQYLEPEPHHTDADGSRSLRQRRSQRRSQASRLSYALIKKRSTADIVKKAHRQILAQESAPPLPGAPKAPAPVPLLRVGDEMGEDTAEPLIDEIASCLREWHDARLHEVVLAREYGRLSTVHDLIKDVDTSRKQLMHDVMTAKELAVLREDTVWNLVSGNKLLSDETIVRSPFEQGRILTADDSVIEMTRLQANMSILDRPPKPPADFYTLYHVLLDVRNLVCESDVSATLHIWLCAKNHGEPPRPVSEVYAVSVPMPDSPIASHEQPRSLFVNLSATDVGVGSESSTIFVVFRLLKDEPVRQATRSAQAAEDDLGLHKQDSVRSRRSFFGGPRRREHSRTRSDAGSTRPGTARSDTATSELSTTDSAEIKTAKRSIGMGAIEIRDLVQSSGETESSIILWTPSVTSHDTPEKANGWHDVIRELQQSAVGGYAPLELVKRFDISINTFATTDLDSLVRNTPTLLHNLHMTEKLGFNGVPTETRNDIYLTLTDPRIVRNAHLAHSKYGRVPLSQRCQTNLANLQLTLEVRKANGERIEDCIYTASNHSAHTAWRTTAIERGESWNQTIRLSVPPDDIPGSHIVMSIAESPNFPFALAWVPLWESSAFVRDGDHQTALYVYDEYSSSIIGGRGAYLALPPWHDKSDALEANAAVVNIRTFLCSTHHSQDPNLLGLLSWRDYYGSKLVELLERFAFIPEIEIVKLLRDIFTALFEILHEYAGSSTYEDLVFYNFVIILGIARDRRFGLNNVIEEYMTPTNDLPNASQCLLRAYHRLLSKPLDANTSRRLRATLKVGDQMLKLIMETSKHRTFISNGETTTSAHERRPDFEEDLQRVVVALMALMRNPLPVLLGTQTLIVQHFHTWLPVIGTLLPAAEVLEIAVDLMDACEHASGKLLLHRLILIVNYSRLDIFKSSTIARQLIASTFRWLSPYWGTVEEVTDQWRDQVRLCCSVVATQMEELGDESCQYVPKLVESYEALQKVPRQPKQSFSMLFPSSYPFPVKAAPKPTDVEEAMLEITALLAAALASEQPLYFDANLIDVTGVLMQTLSVQQSILNCKAFPKTWISLHVSHHRYAIKSMNRIYDILIQTLPDPEEDGEEALEFDDGIWRVFFDTLLAAVNSPALAMETFPEQKRRAVWKIAGDVREEGANLIQTAWYSLGWGTDENTKALHGYDKMGGYQVQFVPDLVPPIVELCLSVHASLRSVAIQVLRTMIISAWEIDQDLSVIQTSTIDCLDKLSLTKAGTDSHLQRAFVEEMLAQFQPLQGTSEDELYDAVVGMFNKVEELLGMLANVHRGSSTNDATKIVETLNLMEFLKDISSETAYVRYVHQLAEFQTSAGSHTEAGLALRLHADRYPWDPLVNLPEMKEPTFPAQTAFERKENLFFQMCQHFERGQCWRKALSAYKELAWQYEENTFDFAKLARTQRAMATIQERIGKGERTNHRYFRVVYRGLGFPFSLRDKEFIYEGYPTDRLSTFEDRLQSLHPVANIVRTNVEPEVEGQHIQIFPVSAHRDLQHTIYQRTKVSPAARDYHLTSSPSQFTTTTRHPANDVPITEQVVEKVVYTCAESFPTILRRSEIVSAESVTLSPIQAAVERTTRKTQELLGLEKRILGGSDDGESMSRLTDDLLLSVDPTSESSVSRYRVLLPASSVDDNKSVDIDLEQELAEEVVLDEMENALKVALLDHALAVRRCLALYQGPDYLPTRAQLIPRFEASFAYEIGILFPNNPNIFDDPSPRPSIEKPEPAAETEKRSGHTAADASETQDDGYASEADDKAENRKSRRLSIPFLRRRSSITLTNGEDEDRRARSRGRDRSQSRTRTGSRLRNNSLTRRLSFLGFGGGGDREEKEKEKPTSLTVSRDSPVLTQANNYTAMTSAQLKKRLSSLRDTTAAATAHAKSVVVRTGGR